MFIKRSYVQLIKVYGINEIHYDELFMYKSMKPLTLFSIQTTAIVVSVSVILSFSQIWYEP